MVQESGGSCSGSGARPAKKNGGILKSNPKYSSQQHVTPAAAVVSSFQPDCGSAPPDPVGMSSIISSAYPDSAAIIGDDSPLHSSQRQQATPAVERPLVRDVVVERNPRRALSSALSAGARSAPSASSSAAIEGYAPATGSNVASGVVPQQKDQQQPRHQGTSLSQQQPDITSNILPSNTAKTGTAASPSSKPKSGSDGPPVIKSISQLVALAQGTSEEAAEGIDVAALRRKQEAGEDVALETEMSFACMTETEYKETLEMAEKLQIGGKKKNAAASGESQREKHDARETDDETVDHDDDDDDDEEITDVDFEEGCMLNKGPDEPSMEEVFFGKQEIFGQDSDDMNDSENDERDEEYEEGGSGGGGGGGGFLDFFSADDDDSIGDPEPAPKPFLLLWRALSSWITPETAELLDEWDKMNTEQTAAAGANPSTSFLRQPYDTSDIGASRCGGLMSMVKMHLPRALEELGFDRSDGHVRRLAESRLANYVRTFNFSDPMVKFDRTLWKALTIVILDICFPASILYPDIVSSSTSEGSDGKSFTPVTIQQLGITTDEYKYLTKSAIKSLAAGGA